LQLNFPRSYIPDVTDYGCPKKPFLLKSETFGLGQTNWASTFWGIIHVSHYQTPKNQALLAWF
jgi:hypothetical protein